MLTEHEANASFDAAVLAAIDAPEMLASQIAVRLLPGSNGKHIGQALRRLHERGFIVKHEPARPGLPARWSLPTGEDHDGPEEPICDCLHGKSDHFGANHGCTLCRCEGFSGQREFSGRLMAPEQPVPEGEEQSDG